VHPWQLTAPQWKKGCGFCSLFGEVVRLQLLPKHMLFPTVVMHKVKNTRMSFPTLTSDLYFSLFKSYSQTQKQVQEPALATIESKIRVGVHRKQGGHAFLNHEEIVTYLRRRENIEVVEITGLNSSTEDLEFQFANRLDIYLAPGGGSSFTGIFVKSGGVVIYGEL
jgi:hypothetical protein